MFDVTLTFDNGPDAEVTPVVLGILADRGIKATFFVLGHRMADPVCRALSARAVAQGHWIGNHTYTHETPLGRVHGVDLAENEIGKTQALIGSLSHDRKFFRPFGEGGKIGPHLLSPEALEFLKSGQYTCVLWSVVPRDWEYGDTWPERALDLIRGKPWSLVVLHDIAGPQMSHLGRFIDAVRAEGGRFRQDFPPECVPLRCGQVALPMDAYITHAA